MRPPSAAAYATFAITWSATALVGACMERGGVSAAQRRAEEATFCPTIPADTRGAFVVHGAKVQDGEHLLDPADVLVSGGEILAVGAVICFRAQSGSVSFVDGAGATLMAAPPNDASTTPPRITPGDPADLVLVSGGTVRTTWHRGIPVR